MIQQNIFTFAFWQPPACTCMSASPNSPLKVTSDGTGDIRDGLERVHLTSSDSGGGGSITGNPKDSNSLVQKVPIPFSVGGNSTGFAVGEIDKVPSTERLIGDGGSPLPDSTVMLLKLHSRLGRILQEACDLHKQIGHLLTATAIGQQPS
ncbi:unnamed protein product [Rodentolepis nana]|uniref:Uncharacterized protein n=1 Tax=Rodentolepis nana TaxID=102285 RepID=A0A0R3T210_RODNA|nr:unnamed protein product [Rodentolepis nana]